MKERVSISGLHLELNDELFVASTGLRAPREYLDFIAIHDGGEVSRNIIELSDGRLISIESFIPFRTIHGELQKWQDRLPPGCFPIAWVRGDNLLLLEDQARGGRVLYLDHECSGLPSYVAGGFNEFLELMRPFDPSTVQLQPGQVISVWKHPGFDELLKKYSKE